MAIVKNSNAGQRVTCARCGKACVIAPDRKTDAQVAVEANTAGGLCPECISTAMLKQIVGEGDPHRAGCFSAFKPEHLRLPHIQQQMQAVLTAGGSRLAAGSLDWGGVIANWDLPVAKKHRDQGLF